MPSTSCTHCRASRCTLPSQACSVFLHTHSTLLSHRRIHWLLTFATISSQSVASNLTPLGRLADRCICSWATTISPHYHATSLRDFSSSTRAIRCNWRRIHLSATVRWAGCWRMAKFTWIKCWVLSVMATPNCGGSTIRRTGESVISMATTTRGSSSETVKFNFFLDTSCCFQ